MALAEPALRQFGSQKLRNLRFRGGSLLGSVIGAGIGIGSYLIKDYDVVFSWNPMLQPDRGRRAVIGPNGQTNGSAYQQRQALRRQSQFRSRSRNKYHSRNRRNCCCSC